MFYYISIFFFLNFHTRKLPVFHSLILALTIFPALYYIVSLLGVNIIHSKYLDLLSILIFLAFIFHKIISWIRNKAKSEKNVLINLIIIFIPFSCFVFLYHNSFLLPGHDPIAAPSLAKIIFNAGCFPETLEPLSNEPLTYPPGYSIFLSIFYNFQNPLLVLLVYKYINICVVSFTPAVWAYYYQKTYDIDFVKSYLVLLSFYYGFFFIDRTLPLALAFAGKNAVLYSYMLFPSVFFIFLKKNKSIIDKIIVSLAGFGLILIHYSFLFMFSLLLFFHILVHLKKEKPEILNYAIMFSCSLILFLPFYLDLKNSSFISLNMPDASLSKAFDFFKSTCFSTKAPNNNYFFWIFYPLGIHWHFKKLAILFFFMAPALHYYSRKMITKREIPASQEAVFKSILSLTLAILAALAILCTLLFKPLFHPEYIRWFVFNYFAVLASAFLIYLSDLAGKSGKKTAKTAILLMFIIIPLFHSYYTKDIKRIYDMINFQKVSFEQVKNVQTVLRTLSKNGPCYLITESRQAMGMGWDLTMQNYKPLDYYCVISDCRILNGSWITLPLENSRKLFNLPSQSFFTSNNFEPVYFIGKDETLKRYLEELENISVYKLDMKMDGNSIYKILKE